MVEVFRTNVEDSSHANVLVDQIHKTYTHYRANFDLEDCDKILRIECEISEIEPSPLINLLNEFGYDAEILPDEIVPVSRLEYL